MIERGFKPQHLSLGEKVKQIIDVNQRELARELAEGRKALPRTSSGKHPSKIVMM